MTKVAITESYAVGCAECAENLIRLCQWSSRDSQVSSLTFRAVPRCDHALPAPAQAQATAKAINDHRAAPDRATTRPPHPRPVSVRGKKSPTRRRSPERDTMNLRRRQ